MPTTRARTALVASALLLAPLAAACDSPSPAPGTCGAADAELPTAQPAHDEDARVDAMSGPGWVAGDSTYSVVLPDGRVLWLYSDSFVGSLGLRGQPGPGTVMVHNALVVQSPDGTSRTLTGTRDGEPSAFFPDVDERTYHWVQDATVEGSQLTVFLARTTGSGSDFRWAGTSVARVSLPDLRLLSITDVPSAGDVAWGAAVMEREDATYVYGVEDRGSDKHLHLAKAPPGAVHDRSQWSYRTADGWSTRPEDSARITDGVANELSVQPYDGGYLLVTSDTRELFSPDVVARTACSPAGPWGEPQLVYTAPEPGEDERFAYNAHAHPGLPGADPDELLVSYNVNTFDSDRLFATPSIYRPRFVRLRLP
ncbi:DUF4185 domain-containing protein [Janibacter sp. Y6]|uniref:DUF4185 domain-containing protein n=1 Tax=Janibacter sp. Y6 TaxID=2913552 RepID=UPI0034A39ABE